GKSRPAWGEARALCGRGLWGHDRARPHRHPDSGLETPPPPLAEGEGANQDWSWGLPPPPKPLPQVEGEFLPRVVRYPDAYRAWPKDLASARPAVRRTASSSRPLPRTRRPPPARPAWRPAAGRRPHRG